MRWTLAALFLIVPSPFVEAAGPKPIPVKVPTRTDPVSFTNDVADILGAKCLGCHSAAIAENRLNMETVAGMLKGGKRGPALVPGKSAESLMFTMASHRVEPVMPPKDKKEAKPLTSEELGLLQLWIDAGAKDDSEENSGRTPPLALGALPPGIHPIVGVDMTGDGNLVACGRANVVQVYDANSGVEIISLGGHEDIIQSLRFSPDGRRLAAGSYQVVTLWNAPAGALEATYSGHGDQVLALAVSRDGKTVASGGLDKTVRLWNPDGKAGRQFNVSTQVLALALSPDEKTLAVGSDDGFVGLWNHEIGKEVGSFQIQGGPVRDLVYLPDGRGLVTVSPDGVGRIWRIPTREPASSREPLLLTGHDKPLRAVAVTPDGRTIVTAGDDGEVQLWHAEDGRAERTIAALESPVLSLAISPDGALLLVGSADKTGRLYDLASGNLLRTLSGHVGPVNAVAFSPDGSRLATAGGEGGVKVWETSSGRGVIAFGHALPDGAQTQPVLAVAFLDNGRVVSASADKTLERWRFEGTWTAAHTLGPHAFRVLALDFNPDGTLLAAGGGEPTRSGEIQLWEVGKGLHVRTLSGTHSDTVFGLRFSPDGAKLASAGADKFMKVTSVLDGKELRAFEGHTHHVMAVDWKSDGKALVTGGADNVLKLWDAETGDQTRTLPGAGKQLTAVRWVPAKPMIVGASGDKLVRFWNPDNGAVARTYGGPGDYVFGVAASNDGSKIAGGGADGVLFIWNGQDGKVLRKMEPAAPKP